MTVPKTLFPHVRTAWRPLVTEADGPATASKMAGTPYVPAGEPYPTCPNCAAPLQLFVQLDTATLPEAVRGEHGEGLIQLFYCTSQEPMCEVDCEAFFPFSRSVVARLVVPDGLPEADLPEVADAFPPRQIVGWEAFDDYPSGAESMSRLGVALTDAEQDTAWEAAAYGDKLGGWPAWIQGVEYPDCPRCGRAMRLVFQVDSEETLPVVFGDSGVGHLTQCPVHQDVLAFGWACG
ncbi:MAG: DUF1963 domain-containing protein [Bacteroidota bacterium]